MFFRLLRKSVFLFILASGVIGLSGCGGTSVEGSDEIFSAIDDVFVESGMCSSKIDCNKKQLVFWDGNEKIFYINFYFGSKKIDPSLIEKAISRKKEEIGMRTKVRISFYNKTKAELLENGVIYNMIFVSPYYRKEL
ncbi:hypothetical protein FUT69_02555 [Xylella taiwanensis]|nr:hypothetical protein [Xylella taiwanensis]AXI83995.1 hypothetical protein AB672_08640 [Xylella taiwanensis]MCD8462356.1 hypothetical protein [Xylella taiwanensis]MCD8466139.1 hypothetical protein [Xylella taiwanensis]MCD8468538.1 hypothetical protein [Xylella taiwanensis]NBI36119.1 hypothetical protein [Xylella taiwanensis]